MLYVFDQLNTILHYGKNFRISQSNFIGGPNLKKSLVKKCLMGNKSKFLFHRTNPYFRLINLHVTKGGQSISKYKDLSKVFLQYIAFAKIVYSFSIADVINYHKLSGLKQYKCISLQLQKGSHLSKSKLSV